MHWTELYREQSVVIMVCREGMVDHNDLISVFFCMVIPKPDQTISTQYK